MQGGPGPAGISNGFSGMPLNAISGARFFAMLIIILGRFFLNFIETVLERLHLLYVSFNNILNIKSLLKMRPENIG
jgi:hypothetical protein